ncbi:meprin A subunit beta-like [Sardina pilchardus]|uniref:meprin A subunit beta-like n=1 Tax=Sardina pilchardus TaxID=27697 RepID=UPI002E124188
MSFPQSLSIGKGCEDLAIAEHEILHALGFWHEQSRPDRDDYVEIVWDNIVTGSENNFLKQTADTLGSQYDYRSIMHYSSNAFSNGVGPTIKTLDPHFQDVIGQRQEMSEVDVWKLNTFYYCSSSVTFLEECSFETGSSCVQSACSSGESQWEKVTSAEGGPAAHHSVSSQGGHFMHFSTINGKEGDEAKLETRRMTPRRDFQCLEFFYYHSGSNTDLLNIWIRTFDSENDSIGVPRLVGQITGTPADYWQLHHIQLKSTKTFQIEFQAKKGQGLSSGGFSLDDINLSETRME